MSNKLTELLSQMTLSTWIDTFGTVFSQEHSTRIPFNLWPLQKKFCNQVELWQKQGFNETANPKARQNGLSEIAGERALKDTMCYNKNKVLCISGNLDKAEEFMKERFLEKYKALPRDAGIEWPTIVRSTKTHIVFSNGSEFMSLPASDTAGQGYSSSAVILDECGAIDLNNNATYDGVYRNVRPSIEKAGKRGWLMQVGTSEPGTGWNDKIKRIREGKDTFTKMFFIGWRADPNRGEAWLAKTKVSYSSETDFKTQYPETIDDFFVVKEGLVVPQFDESKHVVDFYPPEHFVRLYFGYDDGYRHPSVFLECYYDYKRNHLYVYQEDYWTEKGTDEKAGLIKTRIVNAELRSGLVAHRKIADSAIWQQKGIYSVAQEFKRGGVTFSKAKKHGGLSAADGSLEKLRRFFKECRITIHPSCNNLINNLMSWKYKKGNSETIEDTNDDGPDVLRYILEDIQFEPMAQVGMDGEYKIPRGDNYGSVFGDSTNIDNSESWMSF